MSSLARWTGFLGCRRRAKENRAARLHKRPRRFETLEPRRMLAADPLFLGATYYESDDGSDARPDVFEIAFEGGSGNTTLTNVTIELNPILYFDTTAAGGHPGNHFGFQFDAANSIGVNSSDILAVKVADGGHTLEVSLANFHAGDKLRFTIDVDHQVGLRGDPIASGAEFELSKLRATFQDPNYAVLQVQPELDVTDPSVISILNGSEDGLFWNFYDPNFVGSGLEGKLRADNFTNPLGEGQEDRTAGALAEFQLEPLPVTIAGTVYHDVNLNLSQDVGEEGLAGVTLALLKKNQSGLYENTGFTTQTDAQGNYLFSEQLKLKPGTYRVVETQPDGFLSVGAVPGTVEGQATGQTVANDRNVLTEITIPLGNQHGVDYDFAEAKPVHISGNVYHDRNDNGQIEPGEEGIGGVNVQIIPVNTIVPQDVVTVTTDANGQYMAWGLSPGTYRIVEVAQPLGYQDGKDTPGTVNGATVGSAINPGDEINGVFLASGQEGIEYNFGELQFGEIHGNVHLSTAEGDCEGTNSGPQRPLAGVLVTLISEDGTRVETLTDANGDYWFTQLKPGTYTIVETTPPGLLDGAEHVGTINGVTVGSNSANDRITGIVIKPGDVATNYDFCEHEPASISGNVYHDRNNNGVLEPGEEAIAGVTLMLLDANGNRVTLTDSQGNPIGDSVVTGPNGKYRFDNLKAGTYTVMEVQPSSFRDGIDSAGTVNGVVVGVAQSDADKINQITLLGGQHGINYNFGEILPASIAGLVHSDPNRNCMFETGEMPLSGVVVQLINDNGQVIATTTTGADGRYEFDDLLPGTYSVREIQPNDYFHGGQRVGSRGGDASKTDLIANVTLTSGDQLTDYNFCELPPSSISGFVFQDGAEILTLNGQAPSNLAQIRNGQRTPDDKPIAGVVLELRDGLSGTPITSDQALPGVYSGGPIRTKTDANGFYRFTGLPSGNYAVYEVHPDTYVDGVDTAGTTSGIAINAHDLGSQVVASTLSHDPRNDAIVRIPLGVGQHSQQNNFSEVKVRQVFVQIDDPPPVDPTAIPPIIIVLPPELVAPPAPLPVLPPPVMPRTGVGLDYSWHLSVIDAGMPRSELHVAGVGQDFWNFVSFLDRTDWEPHQLRSGRWTIGNDGDDDDDGTLREFVFGIHGAIPVVGDWNGDGVDELGLFYKGEWFLDLNGNGIWDEGDLWIKLGEEGDRPVVGDWDGDGKDDIGIFGPMWAGDPRAIKHEPGLPDQHNVRSSRPKNVPPTVDEATDRQRVLRLTSQGKPRADVIDHVFQYGKGNDVPVTGDWNGDGIKTIGVFKDGQWRLDTDGDGRFTNADKVVEFGAAGDRPVVGDFNGNGVDDLGVYRDGKWYLDTNGNRELDAHDKVFELGGASDNPIVGDFDGDGVDEPGTYAEVVSDRIDGAVQ